MTAPRPTRLVEGRLDAHSVGAPVEYRVLLPTDHDPAERLPRVLHLHGAMSSSASLARAQPLYDALWGHGFPRAVVACASTPTQGGFYIDRPGAGWETLVADEFPAHLDERFGPPTRTALLGASMGGYGALKIAFAAPERYAAVAAISPAVFPGETPDDVPERTVPSVLGELHTAMSGGTGDPGAYAAQSVYGRLCAGADAIRASGLRILLDCGAEDEFRLYEGATYLHDVLAELRIAHDYRLVDGAGHIGPEAERRTAEAIGFVGGALGS